MYTMFLAFTLAAMYFVVSAMRWPQNLRGRLLQALAIGLTLGGALWSHYAAMTLIVAMSIVGIAMLFAARCRAAGAAILGGVGIALLLSIQGLQKLASMADREKLPYDKTRDTLGQILFAGKDAAGNRVLFVLFLIGCVIGLIILMRRRFWPGLLLTLTIVLGLANLLIASRYRQIEGARYLIGLLPAIWIGLSTLVLHLMHDRRRWLARTAAALFVAGLLFAFSRCVRPPQHPQAAPLVHAARTLPTLGYRPGDLIFFAPEEPYAFYASYYGLNAVDWVQDAIGNAFATKSPNGKTLGRRLPPVLWVLVVAPCRPNERGTPADGLGLTQTAARCYGKQLQGKRLPEEWRKRRLSIVRLTEKSIDVWTDDGKPR